MEKREVRYLVNYKKEVYSLLKKYNLSDDIERMNCVDDIKDIMLIDMDLAIKNKCSNGFKEILSILLSKIEKLQSYKLFEFLGYLECIIDMLEIFEEDIFINL